MAANQPKKEIQLLASARSLFWKHGFKRVSVEEICREAGISKMTFYRSYENKIELAKAVFDQEIVDGLKRFREILGEKVEPREKIGKLIAMKQAGAAGVSTDFLKDFYTADDTGLKNYVDGQVQTAWNVMLKDFKKAQRQGVFRKDIKPAFLFYFMQAAGGLLADQRLHQLYNNNPTELLNEFSNFFAFGISPRQ